MGTLTKSAYRKLIYENMSWLKKKEHSLEKMHIMAILKNEMKERGTPEDLKDGGEYFQPRHDIEQDSTPGCFVCGDDLSTIHTITASVLCKETSELIVAFFPHGAITEISPYNPGEVMVKIGACKDHSLSLSKLHDLTLDGVITTDKVNEALDAQKD